MKMVHHIELQAVAATKLVDMLNQTREIAAKKYHLNKYNAPDKTGEKLLDVLVREVVIEKSITVFEDVESIEYKNVSVRVN